MYSVLMKTPPTGVSFSFLADTFSVVLSVSYLVVAFRQLLADAWTSSGLFRY